jgi:hypothetical protein
MSILVNGILVLALLGLFVAAFWRPWIALAVLVGLLPFNGVLLDVVARSLGATSTNATLLAAWHDALAGGFVVAAATDWLKSKPHLLTRVELMGIAVFAGGAISLIVAPHLLTAVYAFRTLYEPIALMLAIGVLARTRSLPGIVWRRTALAIVLGAAAASLYAIFQVYVGGVGYLVSYYQTDGRIPPVYFASTMSQPRAFGPFTTPNELGAYLVLALVLLAVPSLLGMTDRRRAWLAALIGFALVLSISRSAWLSACVAMLVLATIATRRRDYVIGFLPKLRTAEWWRVFGAPALAFVVLSSAFVFSSGLPTFIRASLGGQDPSAAAHANSLIDQLGNIVSSKPVTAGAETVTPRMEPFGMGLGTAGAKSARFGETASDAVLNSETWYVDYALQAGYVGLALLLLLAGTIVVGLWRRRAGPLPRAVLAGILGLAVGAVFIPVLDEPSVAVPLWSLAGLAMASALPGGSSGTAAVEAIRAG